MGKDKIKPKKIGELFFEIFKYTVNFNQKVLEGLS